MNLNTITRDGVTWEQRAPGEIHYATRRDSGHLVLHARRDCSRGSGFWDIPAKVVETLWRKDADDSTTAGQNGVEWCETCAVRPGDGAG